MWELNSSLRMSGPLRLSIVRWVDGAGAAMEWVSGYGRTVCLDWTFGGGWRSVTAVTAAGQGLTDDE